VQEIINQVGKAKVLKPYEKESDPNWGYGNASEKLENPKVKEGNPGPGGGTGEVHGIDGEEVDTCIPDDRLNADNWEKEDTQT